MAKRIYLDYASLTPIDPRVLREMKTFSAPAYANPSSLYKEGVAAKKALEAGRKSVAAFIHGHVDEIIFTSGGTEANGLALEGAGRTAHRNGIEKPHLIISAIEHSSIMECANMMEKHGVEVTRLGVDSYGLISLDELKKAVKPNTFMVSIMTVNNEIGTVQPIREIAKVIRHARQAISGESARQYPLFHTDAAQAALYEELNVERLGVDLLTLDGSKVYGPRGVGALYVKRGTPIEQIIYGGGQERGLRSGTENIPGVAGFAKALEIASALRARESLRIAALKEEFWQGLKLIRPEVVGNGFSLPPKSGGKSATFERVTKGHALPAGDAESISGTYSNAALNFSPHILNVSIPAVDNEFFVLQLDAKGVACSTKSSCLRDEDESYVLKAIGRDSKTSIRFSFGRWTKKADIRAALARIRLFC